MKEDQKPIVQVDNVSKNYPMGANQVKALKGVSIQIDKGVFLAIAGPSGSGKTTLLNIIGCIEKPTSGGVRIDGIDVSGLSLNAVADLRKEKIGFIFQNFNLFPVLTALENVEFSLFYRKEFSRLSRKKLAEESLAAVGLGNHFHHKPMQLSGGQRQRVAIARAMVSSPRMILADEPTANLDHQTGIEILDLMKKLNTEQEITFVFSTHDPKVIQRASRVMQLFDGVVIK